MTTPVDLPRILVLGASGGLGLRICEEVVRQLSPGALVVGDYRPDRGNDTANRFAADFVSVDIRDLAAFGTHLLA